MNKFIYAFFACATIGFAQTKNTTNSTTTLDEVEVNFPKFKKKKSTISQEIESLNQKQIEFQNSQSTADLLQNSGKLFVQKSQQGGGSPVIRGFESNRILLLIDGVRQNNLIFRGGHLQNVITIDQNIIENIDVFYGSGSTFFGSDALGGAVNFTTKKAKFLSEKTKTFSGSINTRYSTVNQEKYIGFDVNYATKNFALLTAASFNSFGDLNMGRSQNGNNDIFGVRPYYISNNNGIDVITPNEDIFLQNPSGYTQFSIMQKLLYQNSHNFKHEINMQFSNSSNIPRYDRLSETNSAGLRFAEWYYGPQKRLFLNYTLSKEKAIFGSDFKLMTTYQNIEESRHNRNFKNYNLQNRFEKVNMFSVDFDLQKKFEKSTLYYGINTVYDNLKSTAFSNNINTAAENSINTRYPNGDNNTLKSEIYASYNNDFNDKLSWNLGGRVGYTTLKSTITDNSILKLPFNNIEQNNVTYSFSTGMVYKTSHYFSLIGNLSSGYRVPNIDDLSKIFESAGGLLIVPNVNLKPEKTITGDAGFKVETKEFELENTYFYTKFTDAIVTDKFTFNGQSTVVFDGVLSQVVANQNKENAFITGFSTKIKINFTSQFHLDATLNYIYGRILNADQSQIPLDHISPLYGKMGLNYTSKRYSADLFILFNGRKPIDQFNTGGEDNQIYATKNGSPAWQTYNFKTAVIFSKNITFYTGVENIFDIAYRTFSSGINAPGRNFYFSAKYNF